LARDLPSESLAESIVSTWYSDIGARASIGWVSYVLPQGSYSLKEDCSPEFFSAFPDLQRALPPLNTVIKSELQRYTYHAWPDRQNRNKTSSFAAPTPIPPISPEWQLIISIEISGSKNLSPVVMFNPTHQRVVFANPFPAYFILLDGFVGAGPQAQQVIPPVMELMWSIMLDLMKKKLSLK
jgi:hypothetical protein